jgi:hypothetical protein
MTPYTLEELLTIPNTTVYLQYRYPEYSSGYRGTRWVRAYLGYRKSPNKELYGKAWRCWERMPTNEEKEAARWNDENA